MNRYPTIDAIDLLRLIDPKEIKWFLQENGYPFVLTEDEMLDNEESIKDNEIRLKNCSDWQFEQEAEDRGYHFPDHLNNAEKIAEMIRLGKDWKEEAIKYFEDVTGKIL